MTGIPGRVHLERGHALGCLNHRAIRSTQAWHWQTHWHSRCNSNKHQPFPQNAIRQINTITCRTKLEPLNDLISCIKCNPPGGMPFQHAGRTYTISTFPQVSRVRLFPQVNALASHPHSRRSAPYLDFFAVASSATRESRALRCVTSETNHRN
jgi:hypothetical protein